MRTISTLGDLRGKRVLVRSDFNVPLKDGVITDDGRIRAALPTLKTLTDAGAKVVIMAHLGRPKGQVDPAFSLAPVAARLAELSGVKVTLASDVVGPSAAQTVADLGEGVADGLLGTSRTAARGRGGRIGLVARSGGRSGGGVGAGGF